MKLALLTLAWAPLLDGKHRRNSEHSSANPWHTCPSNASLKVKRKESTINSSFSHCTIMSYVSTATNGDATAAVAGWAAGLVCILLLGNQSTETTRHEEEESACMHSLLSLSYCQRSSFPITT